MQKFPGNRHALAFVVTMLMMGAFNSSSHANVIFSTFGAGDSFDMSRGETIGPSGGFNVAAADSFSSTTDFDLASVEVAVFSFDGSFATQIAIHSDATGEPGAILGSVSSVITQGPAAILPFDFTGVGLSLLANTTYWVSMIVPNPGGSTDSGAWNFSNFTNDGRLLSLDGGTTWPISNPTDLAFRINSPMAVAEPGTLVIMALGLAGLGLARRKRMI